jgi:urease accessory protein
MTELGGIVRLRAERREGRSVVVRRAGSVPVAARVLRRARAGFAEVALVQTAGGPVGGDRLEIDVEVGAGAALEVGALAATLVLPGRGPARQVVRCRVADDGRLIWRGAPVIVASGAAYEGSLELDLGLGAAAVVRETVVRGRHGETGGACEVALRCDLAGEPLLRDAVRAAPGSPALDSAAVLGGASTCGSVALLGLRAAADDPDECALARPGMLVRGLAPDALALARRLAPVQAAYTRALTGGAERERPMPASEQAPADRLEPALEFAQ